MNELQKIFLNNLKDARKRLGYLQMKLAELANISTSFVAEIERGNKFPSSNNILKISKVLGLKPYQLFLDKSDVSEWNKYKTLSTLMDELKNKINSDIENLIKKHL